MCRWTHRGAERLTRPGALSRPEHLGGWFQHDGRVAAWLKAFLPAWIAGQLREPAPKPRPAPLLDRVPAREAPTIENTGLEI
jgi:GMP synthase (glutamine-hydrolysing)